MFSHRFEMQPKTGIQFADVAGVDEAKQDQGSLWLIRDIGESPKLVSLFNLLGILTISLLEVCPTPPPGGD